ncbi:MAG: adenine-specific DNA-methyltransferase [Lachnospiraceae bacterium]|nr:adenine-specific DNA-methyltransferase [Lachnospiraceae bacterium]
MKVPVLHKEPHPLEKAVCDTACDFRELFQSLDFEEIHNHNSMAICGDCLKVLGQMKECSVHLIFADAPYNIGKNFGNNRDHWDTDEEYLLWCQEWIDACMRVLKDDGTMYFMTATQYMPFLDLYVSKRYHVLCRIVWTYDSSGVQSKKMFGSLYEPILMIHKSPKAGYTFNGKDISVETRTGAKRKLIDYRKTPPQPYNTEKVPGNVWEFSRVRFKMEEYENHPTQKPEAMLERVIRASSNPGDIVLDPFSGSFTTSAVAVRLGRNAVGIDLNREYFEMGIRRTGIGIEYQGKLLQKVKIRKTNNKSKYIRGEEG